MQTIQKPSGNTMKILGKPKASEEGLRWMTYVLSRKVEEGVLQNNLPISPQGTCKAPSLRK